jgi:hypothetical protein
MFRTFDTEPTHSPVVSAELIGSDTASAMGLTVRAAAPMLMLCRKLIEASIDPGRPLIAYRGNLLSLRVSSIGTAARLTVDETRTGFARWKAFPHAAVSSGIAPSQLAARVVLP